MCWHLSQAVAHKHVVLTISLLAWLLAPLAFVDVDAQRMYCLIFSTF